MDSRILPPSEWDRLVGTELEELYPLLNPETAHVIVVEEAGAGSEIIGTWAVYPQIHAEGVWVSPKHRLHSMVPRHLFKQLKCVLDSLEAQGFLTASVSDDVSQMLLKNLGATELPGRHFAVPSPTLGGA